MSKNEIDIFDCTKQIADWLDKHRLIKEWNLILFDENRMIEIKAKIFLPNEITPPVWVWITNTHPLQTLMQRANQGINDLLIGEANAALFRLGTATVGSQDEWVREYVAPSEFDCSAIE